MTDEELNPDYDNFLEWVEKEGKAHTKYRKRAKKVVEQYIDEEERVARTLGSKFNILYSNVETIHSAVLSETPAPDVRRRYPEQDLGGPGDDDTKRQMAKLKNKISKDAALVIERALAFSIDDYDFKSELDKVVNDRLVPGLGISRVVFDPDIRTIPNRIPVDIVEDLDDEGAEITRYQVDGEDVEPEFDGEIPYVQGEDEVTGFERVFIQHYPWDRFIWEDADCWRNVSKAGFIHFLDQDSLKDQFDNWDEIPLGYTRMGEKVTGDGNDATHAKIYEVFCKRSGRLKIFSEGMKDFIQNEKFELGLEGFYPFPPPLMANTKSGSLIPVPDYAFYEDQARELDELTKRIFGLVKQLKHRGIYDSTFGELIALKDSNDGDLVPVTDMQHRVPGVTMDNVVKYFPTDQLIQTIRELIVQREQLKQTIYEITGISDILRGATKASETLGAQKLKSHFGGLRIANKQAPINAMIRQIFRMKAEIIAEHFSKETLTDMTGIEVTDDMMALLRSQKLRTFKIDVESDSTVFKDMEEEQKNRTELLASITQYLTAVAPAVQAGYLPLETAKEMLLFAVRAFKSGRELEDSLDEIGGNMGQLQPEQGVDGMGGAGPGDQIQSPELQAALSVAQGQAPNGGGLS